MAKRHFVSSIQSAIQTGHERPPGRHVVCIWMVSRDTCNISYQGTWRIPPSQVSFADGTSPNHQIRLTGKEKASVTDGRASKLIAWRLFIPTTSLIDDEMLLIRCRHSDFIYSVYQQRDKSEGKHTLGRKKTTQSFIKCICADPWTPRWATNSAPPPTGSEDKN